MKRSPDWMLHGFAVGLSLLVAGITAGVIRGSQAFNQSHPVVTVAVASLVALLCLAASMRLGCLAAQGGYGSLCQAVSLSWICIGFLATMLGAWINHRYPGFIGDYPAETIGVIAEALIMTLVGAFLAYADTLSERERAHAANPS